jgi:periplasmic divalent cation tolerance protein
MADHYAVTVTAPSAEEAGTLGRLAVERRLAACAQVSGPITSTYWWEGEVTTATEWVCTLKTSAGRLDELVGVLRGAHPYQVPEVLAQPIAGEAAYLAWVDEVTAGGG